MSRTFFRRCALRSFASAAVIGLIAAGCQPASTPSTASWPQWRGPARDDHSPDTGLLKTWPKEGPSRVWLSTNTGLGYSGFAIVDGRLFTMGLREDQEFLIALDAATGKELWATPAGPRYPNNWGDGPRSTPTVDGDRVYALGGRGLLVSASAKDGTIAWSKSLVADLGGTLQDWGYTEAPLVVGNKVIVTPGGSLSICMRRISWVPPCSARCSTWSPAPRRAAHPAAASCCCAPPA
jgi:outer membrane protein assembly factor BamB